MRKTYLSLLLLLALAGVVATAAADNSKISYNYITAADLESRLRAGEDLFLLDIQVEEEFSRHHIKGAVPTHAYPVKSEAEQAKVGEVLNRVEAGSQPVVIVCPRGGGGATRTYDYLLARGVAAERLLILEKGQDGWQCEDLTEKQ